MQIVYEDKNFLVLSKPAGIIVHPKNLSDKQSSVTQWLDENYPKLKEIGEPFIASGSPILRYGIVHRLDKETSGLLIIAKTTEAFFYFKNLFQERKIKKYYLALAHGKPKIPKGKVILPLGRIGLKKTIKIVGKKIIDKKEAETEYRTLKQFKDFTLLEVMPKTGRTHQIRVHLRSIGLPVVGDRIYGLKNDENKHLFLHANKLDFKTPDGKSLVIELDPPDYFQEKLDRASLESK